MKKYVFASLLLLAANFCIMDAQVVDNIGCHKDFRPEVAQFCDYLNTLQGLVNQGKSITDQGVINALNNLNPAGRKTTDSLAVAVSVRLATKNVVANLAQLGDQVRNDQQTGANSTASGTTSLVSKVGSAELMSLALSTGALTQSVNGSTATLNSNADELFRILTGDNPDCVMNCSKALGGHEGRFQTDVLNPLNFSASFQLAQSSQQTTTTTGQASGTTPTPVSSVSIPTGAGKLTAIGAKFQLKNKYDPRSSAFQTLWQSQVTSTLGSNASTLASDVNALYAVLDKDATFKSAETDTSFTATLFNNATSDSSGKALLTAFENLWNSDLNTALNDPKLPAAVATVIKDRADFRQAWASALASAAGTMLSIQYNYNQPLNQPKTHDITVIGGYNWGIYGSLTFNGAVSIYQGALPAGAQYGRVHFGQASGQYDRNLSSPTNPYQIAFSLAGYWQYQPNPSVINIPAGTVAPGTTIPLPNGTQEFVGTAGNLWVTQAQLTIKSSTVNIPIGVSWSNKTDLLQGSKVGAQVGISYSFSSLAGIFQ